MGTQPSSRSVPKGTDFFGGMWGGEIWNSFHVDRVFFQGSLSYPKIFGRIKQCQCIVILRDVPYNGTFFGLVIYNIMTPVFFKDWSGKDIFSYC